jgi:hypothetical protein
MLAHKGLKISSIGLALKGLSKKKVSENWKIRLNSAWHLRTKNTSRP